MRLAALALSSIMAIQPTVAGKPHNSSKTPALSELGERIATVAKKHGKVIGEGEFEGRKYKLLFVVDTFVLLNDKGHVILIAKSSDEEVSIMFDDKANVMISDTSQCDRILVDGTVYFLAILKTDGGPVLSVITGKGLVIFGIMNPCGMISTRFLRNKRIDDIPVDNKKRDS